MKVVFATGIYPPEIGGPATYAALVEGELKRRGWGVEVLPFRVVRAWPSGVRHLLYMWKLWRASRFADVVFAQDTVSVGLPAALVAQWRGLPLVLRVPGDFAWEQATQRFGVQETIDAFQGRAYGWRVELLRRVQRWVVNRADRVLAPSRYFADLVSCWLIPGKRPVEAIYNGVSVPMLIRQSTNVPTILTAARLVPWKGIDVLIRILADLPSSTRLVIVGEGPDRSRLEELARSIGVHERVEFTGALPRETALQRVINADIFVLASTFESFSFQLVEAMMLGSAIVAQDIGNLQEMVKHEVSALLVPPQMGQSGLQQAIMRLLEDRALRERLGETAKQSADKFSVQASVNGLERLLQEAITQKNTPRL